MRNKLYRHILIALPIIIAVITFCMQTSAAVAEQPLRMRYDDSGTVTLILLRHAKSDKSNMNMPDIERPIEESGREEAKEMGAYIRKNVIGLDAIVSSPSVRTKQTLEIICPLIGFDYDKVIWDSSLYACSGDHLVRTIKEKSSGQIVMYVGHNPSITDAANALQSEQKIEEVKTCGVVEIWFSTAEWSGVSAGNGRLSYYAKPK